MSEKMNAGQTEKSPLAKIEKLTAVKGMNDILPPDSARWEWLEDKVRTLMGRYAYRNIRTPILEHTQLFVRGIGEVTDIVEKEMYSFEDRADKYGDHDHLTMRPENTASVVRAVTEHNLLYEGGKRLYYMGPMFRRERPQRGRYRQFHQIGAEALGFAGPEVDAELILLAAALWKELGARLEPTQRGQETRFDLSGVETIDGGAMALLVQKKWDLQSSGARCEFVGTVQKISDMKP